MSDRSSSFEDVEIFQVDNKSEFNNLQTYGKKAVPVGNLFAARCQNGEWLGPGRYALLSYHTPCPRGCCTDWVLELIPAKQFAEEISSKIKDFAKILKECRR